MEFRAPEPRSWAEAVASLGVVLGTTRFVGGQPLPVVALPVAPHLRAYATFGDSFVEAETATRWGKSFVEVVGHAVTNLTERPPELVREGRLLRMIAGDGAAAARLLVPGFVAAAQEEVDGRAIFAIPERGTCLVAGAIDPEEVALLFDAALTTWHESDEPLSPVVYTKTDEGDAFEPLRLGEDHPSFLRARRAEVLLLGSVYAEQRASLEGLADAPELAPFEVASHDALGVVTASVALEESPALLPASELVLLRPASDAEPVIVRAASLAESHLLVRVPDFDPPRYALVRFPSPGEIAALVAAGA